MTREQLIELRWLLKTWNEELEKKYCIENGLVTVEVIIEVIDKEVTRRENE